MKNISIIFAIVVIFAIVFVISVSLWMTNMQSQSKTQTSSSLAIEMNKDNEINNDIHFGICSSDNCFSVNTKDGSKEELFENGYELVSKHAYIQFPKNLILKKDAKLYLFNIKSKNIKQITDIDFFKKNDSEDGVDARILQSVTEKDEFLIRVYTYNDTDFGIPNIKRIKSFFYNSSENKAIEMLSQQWANTYDSQNKKMFNWYWGEGAGSVAPISVKDLNGNDIEVLYERLDDDKNFIRIRENGDMLMAVPFKQNIKDGFGLQYFSIKDYKSIKEIDNDGIEDLGLGYSMIIDEKSKTVIQGNADNITLYRFDETGRIINQRVFLENKIYANFIFVENAKLYYLKSDSKNKSSVIKVVNLNHWEVEKEIKIDSPGSEITLFKK